jgi:hypothetical protein
MDTEASYDKHGKRRIEGSKPDGKCFRCKNTIHNNQLRSINLQDGRTVFVCVPCRKAIRKEKLRNPEAKKQ